jgi:hypothetical protein
VAGAMRDMDEDGNGSVSLDEFMRWWAVRAPTLFLSSPAFSPLYPLSSEQTAQPGHQRAVDVCAQDNGGKAALKSETPAGVIHVASASSIWNEGGLIKIQAPNPKDPTGPERV